MPTAQERDALVRDHLRYVDQLAREILRTLPLWVAFDDLRAAGLEGLADAAGRYDPARGAQFKTFAYYRIRGAIFDHIRRVTAQDPRQRARATAHAAVDEHLERTLGTRPRDPGDPRAEAGELLVSTLEDAAAAYLLGELSAAGTGTVPGEDPEHAAGLVEAHEHLRDAMTHLPDQERDIIDGVYFRHLTIEQAGKTLGLTKGWASRLHARALRQLREVLAAREHDY